MMSSLKGGKWVHNCAESEHHERGLLCVMCELISLLLYACLYGSTHRCAINATLSDVAKSAGRRML